MEGHEKNRPRRTKIQKSLYEISFFLELLVAAFVIVLVLWFLFQLFFQFFQNPAGSDFTHFLEMALNIVIGIEFLKMLCRHNMDSVVEVMLFTLARHMIVTETGMLENLLCVAGAALLFVVRKFLFVAKIDKGMEDLDVPEDRVSHTTPVLRQEGPSTHAPCSPEEGTETGGAA